MKWKAFAKRNYLETIRDPLTLIFCFAFPVMIFIIFEIVDYSLPAEAKGNVPQFQTASLFTSVPLFAFTFLMLFVGLLVSKDRSSAFLSRLRTSPMKASDFIIGYSVSTIPLGLIQIVLITITALCFGYYKDFTWGSLLSLVLQIPTMLLFIAIGLLLGSVCHEKALGGVASGVITLSIFFSGMFMAVTLLAEPFQIFMKSLPFYNATIMAKNAATNVYNGDWVWQPIAIVFAYLIVIYASAILAFNHKMKADHQ